MNNATANRRARSRNGSSFTSKARRASENAAADALMAWASDMVTKHTEDELEAMSGTWSSEQAQAIQSELL